MSTLEEWDGAVAWFDRNMGEHGDPLNRALQPVVLERLGDLSGQTVLDCGCGSGYLAAELARGGAREVVGLDFSPEFIALCRRKYESLPNLRFVRHDLSTAWPLDSGSAHVVLSKMVLQYMAEIRLFSQEARRVLSAGGRLVALVDHPFHAHHLDDRTDYFDERPRTKLSLWGKVDLTWYPRTVATYCRTFLDAGFDLAEVIEIPFAREGRRVPRVLGMTWRNPPE
jgi:SAM-dependent methyltransferase